MDFQIVLLGYTSTNPKHTNWYPWDRFKKVFDHLGYDNVWIEPNQIPQLNSNKRRILICWNLPDSLDLVKSGLYRKQDIIIQKLTSLSKYDSQVNWTKDPLNFFKNWRWTLYKITEELYDNGVNIYNFGCKTDIDTFPEKKRICDKLKDRQFWIPWGSSLYDWSEIQNMKPIIGNFKYDIGFVGSLWGTVGRGNIDSWSDFIKPLLNKYPNNHLAGVGQPNPTADDETHKSILKYSKLCPIVNAPSWQVEKGVQDRFWTVFTTGRFGVVDSEGIYDFFNEDEVVCETDPGEYVKKSIYYLENIDKQKPYILKVQERIKNEYNYYNTWKNILDKIIKDN
jgi:hypothetical protein